MRTFDYSASCEKLLTGKIVLLIAQIYEYRGREKELLKGNSARLLNVQRQAELRGASVVCKQQGLKIEEKRLKELLIAGETPLDRGEKEIAGYGAMLRRIKEEKEFLVPRANTVLRLHRDLYKYSAATFGGHFKNVESPAAQSSTSSGTGAGARTNVGFKPMPPYETPAATEAVCDELVKALEARETPPLLLIPLFILDFLCVRPFYDGNRRMSYLLTLLLLCRSGFEIASYVSLEAMVEKSEKTENSFNEAFSASCKGWHEADNDCTPFVEYFLRLLLSAYESFFAIPELAAAAVSATGVVASEKLSKPEQIRRRIEQAEGKISKAEILALCPGVSASTCEKTLISLGKQGIIKKVQSGRYAAYEYIR